ncbi:phosphoribosylamine--glycine ligase [Oligella sp. HMSC05A10]|uniref:phosphoribosylamine--glycine ligase n=1 Tax=Oligella TaxID=90243 RepID=UPI00037CF84A|nr:MULTISPECIES: phosphoribosylamine--glycine ligase [Oligella]OFS82391.1 phosphoribosylamine--glycine ligase [Oligella sp. HMSC05A10]PMC16826.1 phosphoribosylamine--glycine ligase [Oligella urethralis]SUA68182.1 Phosphoribosylamine--glycine ligase [Oligella urethralis]
MNILVIGGGGREHALAWRFSKSSEVDQVFVAPGNGGTASTQGMRNINLSSAEDLLQFAKDNHVALTVVGPEAPLAAGVVDVFRNAGLAIFGPTKAAAQLESSKDFAKAFMVRHQIPTAAYASFTEAEAAHAYVEQQGAPIVIKADGLAAGKGVVVAMTLEEAHQAIDDMLGGQFGQAGALVVIEEFLAGEEASFIVMCDGNTILPLASSQDHKRQLDGDQGPNTGGMGAYSPAPIVNEVIHERILSEVIIPTIEGMRADGIEYTGFLYAGVMIGEGDDATRPIKVLEFNCRLGDPETQPLLMRIKNDFVPLFEAATQGKLDQVTIDWDPRSAIGVVLAAHNYPAAPRTGDVIHGLGAESDEVMVFHAGTQLSDGEIVTSGGRVLCVTALGETIQEARQKAYAAIDEINFDGMQYRSDIAWRAIK